MKHINPQKFSYKGVDSLPKSEDANGMFMDGLEVQNHHSNEQDFLFGGINSDNRHPIFNITGKKLENAFSSVNDNKNSTVNGTNDLHHY
jgi:hypothetical protein